MLQILVQGQIRTEINYIIESMQHPFFMMIFGLIFWFTFVWSTGMAKRKQKGVSFIQDQKDEMVLAFIGGLIFLIWDDEILQGYYDWRKIEGEPELKPYYYLVIAPAIDWIIWTYKKIRKTENGN